MLKSAAAIPVALAAPRIALADRPRTVNFAPQADLASLDPVWTTADVTRNYALAVFDTLYAYDAQFQVQPQMVDGHRIDDDGKTWELTLRDGLTFHDGEKVLARDCAASIQRFGKRNSFGQALMSRVDEITAPSDLIIRFRLKKPFPLLRSALAEVYCAIMPMRLAQTDPIQQIPEAIGSGPFKFIAGERIPGSRVVFAKNGTYMSAQERHSQLQRRTKDRQRRSSRLELHPGFSHGLRRATARRDRLVGKPCSRPAATDKILQRHHRHREGPHRRARMSAIQSPASALRQPCDPSCGGRRDGPEGGHGGCRRRRPSLYRTDIGLFAPGTPMANTAGVEITRGPKDYAKLKQDLAAAGYNGEKIVVLAASNFPTIWAEAQVATDTLSKIGFIIDLALIALSVDIG